MNVRLLLTATALSLGLATAATAQGMQAQPGMDPGMQSGMGDDMGGQQRPAMKRSSGKRMTKSMKGNKKTMRSRAGRMKQGGQDAGGGQGMGGADGGM